MFRLVGESIVQSFLPLGVTNSAKSPYKKKKRDLKKEKIIRSLNDAWKGENLGLLK